MKECKKHKWRIGAGIGAIINKKLEKIGLNIWCEKCSKKIIAHSHYKGYYEK